MKTIITIAIILCSIGLNAQTKKHVYYDTVKTVTERVDYAPDTIPVFFKETVIIKCRCIDGKGDTVIEKWHRGFVVWQTYKKVGGVFFSGSSTSNAITFNTREYYTDAYEPSKGLPGIFLYENKTKCKNIVSISIKQ